MIGKITAVRVQDLTRNIWYRWDYGAWNNSGGSGTNAPVGETPRCTNNGQFYIAVYVVNPSSVTGEVGAKIYVDDILKIAVGRTVAPGAGVSLEKNLTMPATGNAHILITGETTFPVAFDVGFDIAGISGGGPNPRILTIASAQGGSTTPSAGTYPYNNNDRVTITVTGLSVGYRLDHWVVNGANGGSTNPLVFNITSDTTVNPVFTTGTTPPPPPPPPFGDNTLLIVGGIGAVLIIVGVAAFALSKGKKQEKKS